MMNKKLTKLYTICIWSILIASTFAGTRTVDNQPENIADEKPEEPTSTKTDSLDDGRSERIKKAIDDQYLEYFQGKWIRPKITQLNYWRALLLLREYDDDAVSEMCSSGYRAAYSRTPAKVDDKRNHIPMVLYYDTDYTELHVGPPPKPDEKIETDILVCIFENTETIYLTKGRRPTSVYFLKSTTTGEYGLPDGFQLDEKFEEGDVDLDFDFSARARAVLTEKFPDSETWLRK